MLLYLPVVHNTHFALPSDGWYCPLEHVMQMDAPAKENLPDSQISEHAALPVEEEYFPASHSVQLKAPVRSWYRPAPQSVQVLAMAAEYLPDSQRMVEAVVGQ